MTGDEIVDAEWEEVPGNSGKVEMLRPKPGVKASSSKRKPAQNADCSAWLDLEFWRSLPWVKGLLSVIAVLLLVAYMGSAANQSAGSSAAKVADDEQTALPMNSEQMLSDWTKFVTGEGGSTGLTLIDGDGKPGEFCSSATGSSMMNFGGRTIADAKLFDFFSWLPDRSNTGIAGAFLFDAASGMLLATRLIKGNPSTDRHHPVDDIAMQVTRLAPGVVDIDGTRYHMCVL